MPLIHSQQLLELQSNPNNIRNICVLAHVDHGKTTLSDFLIASNGIISPKLAGKVRYLDSRPDEQIRGITMKSSAISLLHERLESKFLINLIDSPGHVDFSNEVSTAVRVCDGALLVVDVVEGVSPQTYTVMKQAWEENLRLLLVFNKIDRMICELKLSPMEAYFEMQKILEKLNVFMSELFTSGLMAEAASHRRTSQKYFSQPTENINLEDWLLEDKDDQNVFFSPQRGNVLFASATDGFAFSIDIFASIYSKKLNIERESLLMSLWGDYYIHGKTKEILACAQANCKKPLFVSLILDNIWSIYDAVVIRPDPNRIEKIIGSLELEVPMRELSQKDPHMKIRSIWARWLPLSRCILDSVCLFLPSPKQMEKNRILNLLYGSRSRQYFSRKTWEIEESLMECRSEEKEDPAPVVILISKMVLVEPDAFITARQINLTHEDILQRKEHVKQIRLQRERAVCENALETKEEMISCENNDVPLSDQSPPAPDSIFVGFGRIFSGTVRKGQSLYFLDAKYDPHLQEDGSLSLIPPVVTVEGLFLLMGRSLEEVDQVPAGNIFGICGLQNTVFKSATLSSSPYCPSLGKTHFPHQPIVRVAVEPYIPSQMPDLVKGLKLLHQADPCVKVLLQESGEHVIMAAGEVHLERCIQDLQDTFAKIQLKVSEPIVPFRETIVEANDAFTLSEMKRHFFTTAKDVKIHETSFCVEASTGNKQCQIVIQAYSLPASVLQFLVESSERMKRLFGDEGNFLLNETSVPAGQDFAQKLKLLLEQSGGFFANIYQNICSFGPKRCGPNILVNNVVGLNPPSLFEFLFSSNAESSRTSMSRLEMEIFNSVETGFQLATHAGPLCEEPMMGLCFSITSLVIDPEIDSASSGKELLSIGALSGQMISTSKDAFRVLFLSHSVRLMIAMYQCDIQVTTDYLGKVYAILSKRRGLVLSEEMKEGTDTFFIKAKLPVVESFGFAEEIRKKTSGLGVPQLVFSHWEIFDVDPFWSPSTEDEIELYGDKADCLNPALSFVNQVRRRKGLKIVEKLVEHAEKQRTLKRNK